jgi:hypothetical protein
MPRSLRADQVREEYKRLLPAEAGDLYYVLYNTVAATHLGWQYHQRLFGHSAERVELLKEADAPLFAVFQRTLSREVLLAIARLTDPAETMGKANASLVQLLQHIAPHIDETLAKDLESDLQQLTLFCDSIRNHRNRLLAHHDLATALEYHPDPLPGIARGMVDEALSRIGALLNRMGEPFGAGNVRYDLVIDRAGVAGLISCLEDAQQYRRAMRQRPRAT